MHKIEVQFSQNLARFAVSLFTREWIEIVSFPTEAFPGGVSLFTREWIEIILPFTCNWIFVSLPLYEGVD